MFRPVAFLLAALLAFQLGSLPASAQAPLTAFVTGEAGHYGGPQDVDPNHPPGSPVSGSCGYGDVNSGVWPGFNSASISVNSTLFGDPGSPLHGCGRCIEVQCLPPNCPPGAGSLIAQVQDQCSSCPPARFNLPYAVWARYLSVNLTTGSVPVSYRRVGCNPPGPIIVDVQVLRPTLGGYIKLAVGSVKGPGILTGVSIRPTPAPGALPIKWLPLVNTVGAIWEASKLAPPPYDIEFASPDATLDALNVIPAGVILTGAVPGRFPTSVQFP